MEIPGNRESQRMLHGFTLAGKIYSHREFAVIIQVVYLIINLYLATQKFTTPKQKLYEKTYSVRVVIYSDVCSDSTELLDYAYRCC